MKIDNDTIKELSGDIRDIKNTLQRTWIQVRRTQSYPAFERDMECARVGTETSSAPKTIGGKIYFPEVDKVVLTDGYGKTVEITGLHSTEMREFFYSHKYQVTITRLPED